MAQNEPIRANGHGRSSEIPDKLYFRIGEVARLCDVPTYVLRFWESEFPQLKPNKGGTGQRLYRRRDVEMALRIKHLLYDERYTIPGARDLLKSELRQKEPQLPLLGVGIPDPRRLHSLRRELEAIAAMLARPVGRPTGAAASLKHSIQPLRSPKRGSARPAAAAPRRTETAAPTAILFEAASHEAE